MQRNIPFAVSNSADEQDSGSSLVFNAPRRRASGHLHLASEGLLFQLDEPRGRTVLVPYEDIGSVVFTPGIMRNRLRITARRPDGFAAIGARRPDEMTALIGRRHRDGAREFVTTLRLRIADAATRAAV